MERWLSNAKLDRFVRRAVTRTPDTGIKPIAAMVQHLLSAEGTVRPCQMLPDEDWVYASLSRLIKKGIIEKYVHESTGGIRYRVSAYPREQR